MWQERLSELLVATWQTVYMVGVSGLLSMVIGIPLGVLLLTTRKHGLLENSSIHKILTIIINIGRSVPFIILLVAIIPVTRLLVGTSIGTTAAIVPLTFSAIPFIARVTENALSEISYGLIEAGLSMGATPVQIITKILLPEGLPAIINGVTLMLITLVGYAAMAGAIGGGGLGDFAIRYGYQRFETDTMIVTVAVLVLLVQIIQYGGDKLSRHFDKR
ncbi:MAG TPA: methionine ABC transporter permease [Gammaproteobacteria bacterium]|nr:methionine ABC transporter permease [Gammaproteobacteria bacterium]